MSAFPIQAIGPVGPMDGLAGLAGPAGAVGGAAPIGGNSFGQMLLDGVGKVNDKLVEAEAQVRSFALDDGVPLHQVTFALEEARMALELALQVRSRLVEGYQQIMQMQL